MALTRLVSRPMLASAFFLGAANAWRNADALGAKAAPVTDRFTSLAGDVSPVPLPQDPAFWVRANAATQIAAAGALATGTAPRLAAGVLAASLVPTTVAGHAFWAASDPAERKQQTLQFFKNVSMLGGLLIAAGDTEGEPGVAWRVRHAFGEAKREARRAAKDARREAKLVKAQLT